MRRWPSDEAFSKCVRERADLSCERCERSYRHDGANMMGLHCSHLFGRRRASVRWDPDNAVAHCFSCHQYLGENPRIFSRWITEYLGSERADELEFRANEILKITERDREDIAAHYRREHRRMLALRAQGTIGRIEFEGWVTYLPPLVQVPKQFSQIDSDGNFSQADSDGMVEALDD
jgi:hypothetical protein